MNIRSAELTDAFVLSSMCLDVQKLHASHHPKVFVMPTGPDFAKAFFEAQLQDPLTHIFIAERDGEALGYILCKLFERPANVFTHEECFILIDQISVRLDEQGQGVGAALIARAQLLARDLGAKRLQLHTWDFNLGAHGFFEHEGFTKFSYRYWLNLE